MQKTLPWEHPCMCKLRRSHAFQWIISWCVNINAFHDVDMVTYPVYLPLQHSMSLLDPAPETMASPQQDIPGGGALPPLQASVVPHRAHNSRKTARRIGVVILVLIPAGMTMIGSWSWSWSDDCGQQHYVCAKFQPKGYQFIPRARGTTGYPCKSKPIHLS